jgi:hypothetical protein
MLFRYRSGNLNSNEQQHNFVLENFEPETYSHIN